MVPSAQESAVRRSGQVAADREAAVGNVIEVAVKVPESSPPPEVPRSMTGLIKRLFVTVLSIIAWVFLMGIAVCNIVAGTSEHRLREAPPVSGTVCGRR
jgi:hypothetical protein